MTDKVTPTQADRDAAEAWYGDVEDETDARNIETLSEDFARHASQARAEGLAEGKLIGAKLMQEAAAKVMGHGYTTIMGYEAGIRALSPADVVKGGDV